MLVCKVCGEPQVLKVPKVLKEKEVKRTNCSVQKQAPLSSSSATKSIFPQEKECADSDREVCPVQGR